MANDSIPGSVVHHRFPSSSRSVAVHTEHHEIVGTSVFLHIHPEWELVQVTARAGCTTVAGHDHPFSSGDLLLIAGSLPHRWTLEASAQHPAVFDLAIFTPETAAGELLARREYRALAQLFSRSSHGLRFSAPTARQAQPLMRELTRSTGLQRMASFLQLGAILAADSAAYALVPDGEPAGAAGYEIQLVQELVREALRHPHGAWSLREAAAHAGRSSSALGRMVRRVTGESFVQYLAARRVARASALLLASDRPIAEVASAAGFRNLAYFNRLFQRHTGIAPRAYRARHREVG